ncbi:LOW QUALITY PROTEIN: uncharacterized protein LOC108029517 [Drosophila biarmipes]|uniref:LOW QUALITY PROTEIN: uncharacterized protein LOC108029517 n=1 Tax=Drosophila biarmipes TaxID=125945 RepID=UPI0007E5FBBF|nr:LOW QUALITY PROTEIN: uncharacterized protein LOC108029517 [Drosophila biarmipes]
MENLTLAEVENHTLQRYDGKTGFLWIFACIYVLSKLTQLLERVLEQRLLGQRQWFDVRSIKTEWELTVQLYEDDKRELDAQVRELREKNLNMERIMVDLRDCNIHLISENFIRSVMHNQRIRPPQSNLCFSHTHFHLTRQVFANESYIDLYDNYAGGKDTDFKGSRGGSECLLYLKMRKRYLGPIADPNLTTPCSSEHMLPIVMSTEKLANLQGMIYIYGR